MCLCTQASLHKKQFPVVGYLQVNLPAQQLQAQKFSPPLLRIHTHCWFVFLQSFRTGSRAKDTGSNHPVEEPVDRGMAVIDPDAVVEDGLVEQLLEAEDKLEASHEAHHLSHTIGGSMLQVEVCVVALIWIVM